MLNQTLKQKINDDLKDSMRAKDALKVTTIRMLLAAIKQNEIDKRTALEDPQIIDIVNKSIKQRAEAAKIYADAGRPELADKENSEAEILKTYLPEQLTPKELEKMVDEAIKTNDAQTIRDMSKVMNFLKAKIQGRANISEVSTKVKAKLTK